MTRSGRRSMIASIAKPGSISPSFRSFTPRRGATVLTSKKFSGAEQDHEIRKTPGLPGVFGTLLELSGLKDGGAEGSRTPDLYNAIVALSQLSYGPIVRDGRADRTWDGPPPERRAN